MHVGASDDAGGKHADLEKLRIAASAPDFQEEKLELEWVLRHPEISRSASLVRFLSFVCNKYFEGESKDIREYAIAVEALGRKESNFDPHDDPIVRVTARTLRKRLKEIYKGEGQGHPVRIVLPLGHYVPHFIRAGNRAADGALPAEENAIDPGQMEGAAPSSNIAPAAPVEDAGSAERRSFKRWLAFAVKRRAVWIPASMVLAGTAIFFVGVSVGRREIQPRRSAGDSLKWGDPVWSDEFDGAVQQLPDPLKWSYDPDNQGDVVSRKQPVYCSPVDGRARECDPRHPNVFLDGAGHLVLRAQRSGNGIWTLGRITTKGLKNFQFGRIEARMKLPVGAGLWPSFVMVGSDKDTVGWPASGSIDVVENVALVPGTNGLGPAMIRSTLHGPRYFGGNGLWHDFRLPNGGRVDDASFHTYGIIWSPEMIQFYVDDPANIFFAQNASDLPEGGEWVFDRPFFLVMSLAVGGEWPGDSDATTPNPADVLVDYVRVYKIPNVPAPSIKWPSMEVRCGSSASSTVSLIAPSYAGRVHLTCSTDKPSVACSLATSIVNFSDTLAQEDTLTISTDPFTEKGRVVASPGRYNVTIVATTISGDRSQVTVPFDVKNGE
ncbi:MAG: glycoside hydrolase family 16 protein [Terracidiphilus sp.]